MRRTFYINFPDFDYETPAHDKYNLETDRLLILHGDQADIEKFAADFSLTPADESLRKKA